jgi:ubiquinone/menaquinone biosynthesis C-methylase UbiE
MIMSNAHQVYFDSIADQWDGWMDMTWITTRLEEGLTRFGLGADETVLDVGCGTGNLIRVLLGRLSERGRVIAVDLSSRMLELARAKNDDRRVELRQVHARDLDLADRALDRVICFSVWPHVDAPEATARELHRVLKPGGWLHVWHIDSRETINQVHAEAGEAVRGDILVPAAELAVLLGAAGFEVTEVVDNETEYVVSARKVAGR